MPGVSFDRAADFYDDTRGYPPGVPEQIRDALVRELRANRGIQCCEIGIGTGRIALPFLQAGYSYTGVDLSTAMLARLRAKLPGRVLPLSIGDVMFLPFASASFDVVLAAHVLHLVADWQQTLNEARRVLKPGGAFVSIHDSHREEADNAMYTQTYKQWNGILAELGYTPERPRRHGSFGIGEQVRAFAQAQGAQTRTSTLTEFTPAPTTARELVARLKARINSGEWAIPDAIHAEGIRRLEDWLDQECAQPDQPITGAVEVSALVAMWS